MSVSSLTFSSSEADITQNITDGLLAALAGRDLVVDLDRQIRSDERDIRIYAGQGEGEGNRRGQDDQEGPVVSDLLS